MLFYQFAPFNKKSTAHETNQNNNLTFTAKYTRRPYTVGNRNFVVHFKKNIIIVWTKGLSEVHMKWINFI